MTAASDPLRALLASRAGERISGSELARALGVSRAAIHKRVRKLRAAGLRIDGASRLGYRWEGAEDGPESADLLRGLVRRVDWRDARPSTQDEAKARALAGEPGGLLVGADRQTAGRGRLGRAWISPPGGLWYSLLLRPLLPPARAPSLSLVAALSWARVLVARGVPARLKWPNDLWVDGRKVGGVLTEMSAEADRVQWVVLGVGLNVRNDPPRETEVPAASLKEWMGGSVDRWPLLADWIDRFTKDHDRYLRLGFRPFRRDYERLSCLTGRRVRFTTLDGPQTGRALGVDDEGRLRVRTPGGVAAVAGGDVSLLRLNSR